MEKSPELARKHAGNTTLSREQLLEKASTLQKDKKNLKKKIVKLEKKIDKIIARDGMRLDKESHTLFEAVIKDNKCDFDENSPKFLLWEQQKKMSKFKNPSSMKWHPVLIRWCLSIYLRSPGNQHLFLPMYQFTYGTYLEINIYIYITSKVTVFIL